jgi:uncharacterized membrane protein
MNILSIDRPRSAGGGLLGLSLALNVFLLALIATHLLRPVLLPAPETRSESRLDRIAAALPADDAERFRAVLDRERPVYQPARESVSAAQRAVAAAIAHVPYDEAAVRDALQEWQANWRGFSARFSQVFLDAVGTLSDEGRARLAQASLAEDARRRKAD